MGEEQIYGLINDGFPLVGLIHICMAEPLQEHEKTKIKFMKGGIGEGSSAIPLSKREIVEVNFDHFSMISSINQMKRLINKGFPKYVGLCAIGLNINKNRKYQLSFDHSFNHQYEAGYFNPKIAQQTIEKIRTYWANHKDIFQTVNR